MLPHHFFAANRFVISKISAAVGIGISILILSAWELGISALPRLMPGFAQITPFESIMFGLLGTGIFLASVRRYTPRRKAISTLFSGMVLAAGIITLCNYIILLGSGNEGWLENGTLSTIESQAGISPHAAVPLVFLSLASLTLNRKRRWGRLSEYFALLALAAAFSAAIGYLYSAEWLFGINNVFGMTPSEAFVFFTIGGAGLMANRRSRLVHLLASTTVGGTLARRLLPMTIIVPTIFGWLRIVGEEMNIFGTSFGITLLVLTSNFSMFGAIFLFAIYVHREDLRRRGAEKRIAESEERYRDLIDHSLGLICTHTPEGVITSANPAALAMIGCSEEELIGQNLRDLLEPEQKREFDAYLRQVVNEGMANGLMRVRSRTGNSLIWRYHNVLITNNNGESFILGHAADVTELMNAQRTLRELSLTDEMTGLYNRRGFMTLAEQQLKLEKHRRTARGLAIIFADMDGLKRINDTFGHDLGSEAIVNLGRILRTTVREADIVARWGGDEFIILTIGSDSEHAEILVARIRDALRKFNADTEKKYRLECSIGVEPITLDGSKTFAQMIAEADRAMYEDKRSRKGERDETWPEFASSPPPIGRPVSSPVIELP